MSMYVRSCDRNILDEIKNSKAALSIGSKEIKNGIAYQVTYNCYLNMLVYCYWMKMSLFPIGFLFRASEHSPTLPSQLPNNFKFKTDGWIVTKDRKIELVTLIVVKD